jgi:hypothetical protein
VRLACGCVLAKVGHVNPRLGISAGWSVSWKETKKSKKKKKKQKKKKKNQQHRDARGKRKGVETNKQILNSQ